MVYVPYVGDVSPGLSGAPAQVGQLTGAGGMPRGLNLGMSLDTLFRMALEQELRNRTLVNQAGLARQSPLLGQQTRSRQRVSQAGQQGVQAAASAAQPGNFVQSNAPSVAASNNLQNLFSSILQAIQFNASRPSDFERFAGHLGQAEGGVSLLAQLAGAVL